MRVSFLTMVGLLCGLTPQLPSQGCGANSPIQSIALKSARSAFTRAAPVKKDTGCRWYARLDPSEATYLLDIGITGFDGQTARLAAAPGEPTTILSDTAVVTAQTVGLHVGFRAPDGAAR